MTNLSVKALDQLSDGVAHAMLTYANDEEIFAGARSFGARSFGARSFGDVYDQYKGPEAVK